MRNIARAMARSALGLEDEANGKPTVEREYCWYVKLSNPADVLREALRTEHHEQWEIRPTETKTGCVRVRKTTIGTPGKEPTQITHTLTTKNYRSQEEGVSDSIETTVEISPDLFKAFKMIAPSGMVKTRCVYQTGVDDNGDITAGNSLEWEVDLFPEDDESETYSQWAKIDLETDGQAPNGMPVDVLLTLDRENDQDMIDEIKSNYMVKKNPAIDKESVSVESILEELPGDVDKEFVASLLNC